jgi:8-oxo-dGTP pyrophosphatase MutT (NUDIX family)
MDETGNKHTPGNVWRPPDAIRPKVIGIAKQEDRLLVCEVLNDRGELKGWCPLGGGIEFGETSEHALKREIAEELGCEITISGEPLVCENIFEHHGFTGHEIILAFPIRFDYPEIYNKKRFQICESRGSMHWVEWIEMERFRSGKEILFPPALSKQIL